MLLGTVLLWALNVTVTKFMFEHGWRPLSYGTIRYAGAILVFWLYTWWRERSFRIAREDWWLVALAGFFIFANQVGFVYSVKLATASTVALLLGATPVFMGLIALVLRLERLQSTFWVGAGITFAGVALIALASGGGLSGSLAGNLLAVGTAFTWACYSTAIAPLMRSYSPFRISSLVLLLGWVPLAITGAGQTAGQHFQFGALMWFAMGFAVIGPLFLTNLLWFTAISRVGPSRASLFSNLQPVFGVAFALALLGEHLTRWEVLGGAIILGAVVVERLRRTTTVNVVNVQE